MLEDAIKKTSTTVYANGNGVAVRNRADDDWYVEPASTVEALFDVERFKGMIYDPACGLGTIPKVAESRGLPSYGSDIAERGYGLSGKDFLTTPHPSVANIVCNPPFKLAEAFLYRALEIASYKVAFLLRLTFLEGQKRRALFANTPLARVHVCSSRISMPPGAALAAGTVERGGGSVAFAWYVWEHGYDGKPTLNWLP